MAKNKILVVYNTCGVGGVPKVQEWIKRIKPLVSQTLDGVTICHSDNGSDDESLNILKEVLIPLLCSISQSSEAFPCIGCIT